MCVNKQTYLHRTSLGQLDKSNRHQQSEVFTQSNASSKRKRVQHMHIKKKSMSHALPVHKMAGYNIALQCCYCNIDQCTIRYCSSLGLIAREKREDQHIVSVTNRLIFSSWSQMNKLTRSTPHLISWARAASVSNLLIEIMRCDY